MKKFWALFLVAFTLLLGCGWSGSNSSQEQTLRVSTILVPLYSYPADANYRDDHQRLAQLRSPKEIIVIINPDSGPSVIKDQEFENIINTYKASGKRVLGYLKTEYARRNRQGVIADIQRYLDFYPQIEGFFLDEVSNELGDFEYYRQIYNYVKEQGNFMVVINPGARVPQEYYSVADKLVAFESNLSFLYNGYGLTRANTKDCFLVYGVRDTGQARELLSYLTSRGASCAYAVDEDPPSWFKLSPYMNVLLE
ncbi:spherulation-specific family 4 protein [Pampinifervens florentissimum]|uniref:spherulation-specific family 4 protein n=1 Tax=Pampinifervens florentissimum TaxID=1632019 RepID=UPI0013B48E2E|nr:spherulation-specific family 4 protein [Hydrogenobacter sp. T-8]QID32606.1 hypothetical protein G3M65_01945 [Hydrogenobacter sp. T-8]